MNEISAIVVDHDARTCLRITQFLRQALSNVYAAADLKQARSILSSQPVNVVFTAFTLPDGSGLSLLSEGQRQQPQWQTVIVASHSRISVEDVLEALRLGAADFVLKPIVRSAVQTALARALQKCPGDLFVPATVPSPESPDAFEVTVGLNGSFKQIQHRLVKETILRFDGNKSAAARALGLPRRSLYRMLDIDR
jgi:two-component system response regulator PilR (NtrC family)